MDYLLALSGIMFSMSAVSTRTALNNCDFQTMNSQQPIRKLNSWWKEQQDSITS
jgi:hypothetical protein